MTVETQSQSPSRLQNLLKPERIPLGTKVVRNAAYNGARLLLLAPLPLLVIPFFLKKLGTSGYGTWAVFLAVSGVTSLADLGLVATLSKHVAEFYALEDIPALNRLVNTGFILYSTIAAALVAVLWSAAGLIIGTLFRSSVVAPNELHILWRYLMLLVLANILTLLFSSVVSGLQRMDLSTGLTALNTLSSAGLSILLLTWGWGLRGVLCAYMAAAWMTLCCYVYVMHKLLPGVRFKASECRWAMAKEIVNFSSKIYATQVAVIIHNQIEKLYLARFVGVVSVGWYDISSDLAVKLRAVPSLVLSPIMPAAAELDALNDQRRLEDLYFRAHKYLSFIVVPFVLYIVLVSKRFVELWVGPTLSVIAVPLSVLLVFNFINLTTGPGFLILVAKGRLNSGLYSACVGIVLNLSVSLILIRAYGFRGAVAGTAISLGLASSVFLYLFWRETSGAFSRVMRRAYLKPILCSLPVGIVLSALTHSRRSSWSGLVAFGVVFGVAYLVLLSSTRFFDGMDLSIAASVLRVPWIARRVVPDA
jgi:O-antigen/teichoic acid export membrane protein